MSGKIIALDTDVSMSSCNVKKVEVLFRVPARIITLQQIERQSFNMLSASKRSKRLSTKLVMNISKHAGKW